MPKTKATATCEQVDKAFGLLEIYPLNAPVLKQAKVLNRELLNVRQPLSDVNTQTQSLPIFQGKDSERGVRRH